MSVELTTIRTRVKGRLDTISGLANYKSEPDAIPAAPFTILGNCVIDYNTDMGGGRDFSFRLFLAVAEADTESAWTELDSYLAAAGTKSVKAALEGTSTPAPAPGDYTNVVRVENCGHVVYRARTFIGAEFILKIPSGG